MNLITGGSGFIGSHFHKAIPNNEIINLDLAEPLFEHDAHFIKGDIRVKDDVKKAIEGRGIRTIISLAAKHHDFGIGHDEYFDTNEDGTRIICECASEFDIKEIIFYSSVAVYGSNNPVTTEETAPIPDLPYGASKLAGEKVLIDWAREDPNRKVLIIRPTVVFGPNNVANMYKLIRQIDSGFYFHLGQASNVKSLAYVENLVKATLFLKNRMKQGVAIYNYSDEPHLTSHQIAETIATTLNRRIRFWLPTRIGILLGLPFDMLIKLTGKNLPISSARIRKLGTQTYHSAAKIAQEEFHPSYSTLEGIRKMVDWYLSRRN